MRIFVSERLRNMIATSNPEKGQAIEARMVNKAIERAQRRVEGRNFDIRKSLLEFDDVANDQRQIVYHERSTLLREDDVTEMMENMRGAVLGNLVEQHILPQGIAAEDELQEIQALAHVEFGLSIPIQRWLADDELTLDRDFITESLKQESREAYRQKSEEWSQEGIDVHSVEKRVILSILDQKWKEHLATMDQLRQAIHLRAYAQKQPKQEYKRESFELFEEMLFGIQNDTIRMMSRIQVQQSVSEEEEKLRRNQLEAMRRMRLRHEGSATSGSDSPSVYRNRPHRTVVRSGPKVGRNETCPCGSGKKYKRCCGLRS